MPAKRKRADALSTLAAWEAKRRGRRLHSQKLGRQRTAHDDRIESATSVEGHLRSVLLPYSNVAFEWNEKRTFGWKSIRESASTWYDMTIARPKPLVSTALGLRIPTVSTLTESPIPRKTMLEIDTPYGVMASFESVRQSATTWYDGAIARPEPLISTSSTLPIPATCPTALTVSPTVAAPRHTDDSKTFGAIAYSHSASASEYEQSGGDKDTPTTLPLLSPVRLVALAVKLKNPIYGLYQLIDPELHAMYGYFCFQFPCFAVAREHALSKKPLGLKMLNWHSLFLRTEAIDWIDVRNDLPETLSSTLTQPIADGDDSGAALNPLPSADSNWLTTHRCAITEELVAPDRLQLSDLCELVISFFLPRGSSRAFL